MEGRVCRVDENAGRDAVGNDTTLSGRSPVYAPNGLWTRQD